MIVNTLSVLLYFLYLFYSVKKYKWYIIPILLFVISTTWSLVSVYALDFGGVYIFELDITSTKSYATSFLVLCNLVLLESIKTYLFKRGFNKSVPENVRNNFSRKKNSFISLFIWICLGVYYLTFLKTGVPLLQGMDRAVYWKLTEPIPVVNILLGNYPLVAFFIGFSFSYHRLNGGSVRVPIIQFMVIIFFFVLAGNKFSALLDLILNFSLAPALYGLFNVINWKRAVKWAFLLFVFFAGAILIQSSTYSLTSKFFGNYGLFSYLFQRIFILQGEIWWKTFQDIILGNEFDPSHLKSEFVNIFNKGSGGYVGLRYLMVQSARGSFIYEVIKGNYLYTGGFPAIILATFPLIFVFPVLYLLGKFFGLIILKFQSLLYSNNLLGIYLIFILYKTYNTMILSGEFDSFFILTNVGRVVILLAIALLIYDSKLKSGASLSKIQS